MTEAAHERNDSEEVEEFLFIECDRLRAFSLNVTQ